MPKKSNHKDQWFELVRIKRDVQKARHERASDFDVLVEGESLKQLDFRERSKPYEQVVNICIRDL